MRWSQELALPDAGLTTAGRLPVAAHPLHFAGPRGLSPGFTTAHLFSGLTPVLGEHLARVKHPSPQPERDDGEHDRAERDCPLPCDGHPHGVSQPEQHEQTEDGGCGASHTPIMSRLTQGRSRRPEWR